MKQVSRLQTDSKMGRARTKAKRRRDDQQPSGNATLIERPLKRAKACDGAIHQSQPVSHPLLSRLYPHIQTLRDYILSRLPASSRLRRKKISSVGLQSETSGKAVTEAELGVARLLDCTVVAYSSLPETQTDDRWQQLTTFSQKGDESYVTLSDGYAGASFSQTEVCRIWAELHQRHY